MNSLVLLKKSLFVIVPTIGSLLIWQIVKNSEWKTEENEIPSVTYKAFWENESHSELKLEENPFKEDSTNLTEDKDINKKQQDIKNEIEKGILKLSQ